MVHEVINALCKREDGDLARMFPVGVIPAGSANALSQVVCDKSGEPVSPEICSFIAIKGQPAHLTFHWLNLSQGLLFTVFISFLGRLIADIDIESETCRCCGACRFDLYGF
jgi:Sphingosine kinase and enzymes related to eukaryotic diacylglycerol kinase